MRLLKNIFTGWNYGKLENEKIAFEILRDQFYEFQKEYIAINQTRLNALSYLKTERSEVVRNLSMAKNLISKIKDIRNDEIQEIKTDAITYFENKSIEFEAGDVTVDFQGHLDKASESFILSLGSSFKRLETKKTYTKADLKTEAAIVAIESLISGISAIFALNTQVNENRRKILDASTEIKNAMPKMTSQASKVYTEVKRIIEIARILNKHNEVFSKKYNEIQKALNSKTKISLFIYELLNKKVQPDDEMLLNLQSLRQFSSEYSKFNKEAKI